MAHQFIVAFVTLKLDPFVRIHLSPPTDALEFTCWNGEIVRVAFALDSQDREVISWMVTTAGISGGMIRDMMVHCVEQRFGDVRAPREVQWLTDNGTVFAAYRTLEIAAVLKLEPCSRWSKAPRATAWPRHS